MSKSKVEQAVEIAELEQDVQTEEKVIRSEELTPEQVQERVDELKAKVKQANEQKDYSAAKKFRRTLRNKYGYYLSKEKAKPETDEVTE